MLSAPSMYYNRFYPFFVVFILYFLTKIIEKRNVISLVGLTLAIFLSSFFKFEVMLFSLMVSIVVLVILFFNKSIELNIPLGNILNGSSTKLTYLSGAGIMATGGFLFYLGKDGYFFTGFHNSYRCS